MKKALRIALLILLVAAACWFSIPRAALSSGTGVADVTVRSNHQTLSEGSYDAEALAEALRNTRCRPCFMESIPETVPEWEISFLLRSGGVLDVYVYENLTVLYTSHPKISYRIPDPDALLQILNQSIEEYPE